jgi:hypothetical protein
MARHKWDPHPEVLAAMPPMRQTLFRPVHFAGNLVSRPPRDCDPQELFTGGKKYLVLLL